MQNCGKMARQRVKIMSEVGSEVLNEDVVQKPYHCSGLRQLRDDVENIANCDTPSVASAVIALCCYTPKKQRGEHAEDSVLTSALEKFPVPLTSPQPAIILESPLRLQTPPP